MVSFSSPNSNAIMSSVEKRHLGVASGVVGTMRMVGQMMSMGIAMMLISLYIGKQTINPATFPGLLSAMRTGFIIFSILSIFGIFASLAKVNGIILTLESEKLFGNKNENLNIYDIAQDRSIRSYFSCYLYNLI